MNRDDRTQTAMKSLLTAFGVSALMWNTKLQDQSHARRLKLVNLSCYLAAISSLFYAVFYAVYDWQGLRIAIWANLLCVLIYSSIPLLHRAGEHAASIGFTLIAYTALFGFAWLLGPESGIHLNYLGAGALAFVLFGARQIRLVAVLLALGLCLHLAASFYIQQPFLRLDDDKLFLRMLYTYSASSIVLMVLGIVWYAFRLARDAEERSEMLLRNILPESIATRLKANPDQLIADRFEIASVLFADIVGFTPKSNSMSPQDLVTLLNEIFVEFDLLVDRFQAEKIKTIGDAYMVVVGIPKPCSDHATKIIDLGLKMLEALEQVSQKKQMDLKLRIGVASGSITAGVIGKAKFAYDVWAPTVNLASRLEAHGEPGKIHICDSTRMLIGQKYNIESASPRELKGIGVVQSWLIQ